jgi:hypothetical protein
VNNNALMIRYLFHPHRTSPIKGEGLGNIQERLIHTAQLFLNSVGVKPVCFLKIILKPDLELNPES